MIKWLNVRQLLFYQTALITYKTKKTVTPAYMGDRMSTDFPYNTRQDATGLVKNTPARGHSTTTVSSTEQQYSWENKGGKHFGKIQDKVLD